ncbi:MAG TPA: hypothetical protein VJ894_08835 [Cryomorphaceae bacterium]|nr:hypothetical protein [Cryomorphaceae bacterium]
MIQFLFQGGHGSHGPRTQALAKVSTPSNVGDIDSTKPVLVPGLHTLAFWGHGDSSKLCGKTASEIVEIVSAWKKLNTGLKTVEIITCNARHASAGRPFANQLKSKFGILSGTKGITIKGLPLTVSGKNNAWSILLAEPTFNSWVYITAPGTNDKLLMEANSLIQFETNANGGLVSYKGDIAQRADKTVRENPQRQWTMNYGYMGTLRNHLVKV